MTLTKEQFNALRREMEEALAPIAAKYGCEVDAGNIKYDAILTTVQVNFRTKEEGKSANQVNFEQYCQRYGFDPDDYGMTFLYEGKTYTLTCFRTTARKYPCMCVADDGKTYGFAPDAVKMIARMNRKDG